MNELWIGFILGCFCITIAWILINKYEKELKQKGEL